MGELIKTKDVSSAIGVHPETIRKWTNKFEVPHKKNKFGHYVYDEVALEKLRKIKEDMSKKEDIYSSENNKITLEQLDERLDRILAKVYELEHQVLKKADDIVSVQVLHQRTEIEEILGKLQALSKRIDNMENGTNVNPFIKEEKEEVLVIPKKETKGKKSWLVTILGL